MRTGRASGPVPSLVHRGDAFIPLFDLVVFLAVPTATRLARLAERERRRFGEAALAPGGAIHAIHTAFMAWAAAYDEGDLAMRSRRRQEAWLAAFPCPVLRLEEDASVEERLARVADGAGFLCASGGITPQPWRTFGVSRRPAAAGPGPPPALDTPSSQPRRWPLLLCHTPAA